MNVKHFLMAILIAVVLLAVAFIPVTSQQTSTYDPWIDFNGDGRINYKDLYALATSYGASGDPTRNVTVTNFPLDEQGNLKVSPIEFPTATNYLTAMLNESHKNVNIGPCILKASNQAVGIGSKNITFLSGGVSGGINWFVYEWPTGDTEIGAGGGASGAGRVEVYDSSNNLLAQFALPLNSMFTVQHVDTIKVYAEAPIPNVTTWLNFLNSYSAFVVASIYWIEH